jgi:hypothetical protein
VVLALVEVVAPVDQAAAAEAMALHSLLVVLVNLLALLDLVATHQELALVYQVPVAAVEAEVEAEAVVAAENLMRLAARE